MPTLQLVRHLPFGDPVLGVGALPDCGAAERLADVADAVGGELAVATSPSLPAFVPSRHELPQPWARDHADTTLVRPSTPEAVAGTIAVGTAGRYEVWAQGSFGRGLSVEIAGKDAGSIDRSLNERGAYEKLGEVDLDGGEHPIVVRHPGRGSLLTPGSGGGNWRLGPVVLKPVARDRALEMLPQGRWRESCNAFVDWLEVVR